jgi:1-acyl-sn-glycerol-3-phosphate acyltransferase
MHYRHPTSIKPGQSRAVFLEEINVEGYTLEQLPQLKARVMRLMEEKLRSYHASWISS